MAFEPVSLVVNGVRTSPSDSCLISCYSPSFQYGLTVFEGIRAYQDDYLHSHPFLLQAHINRLLESALLMGFHDIPTFDQVTSNIELLLSETPQCPDYYIKTMLCYLSEGSWATTRSPDIVSILYRTYSLFTEGSFRQVRLRSSSISRLSNNSLPPRIKCGANYINGRLATLDVNSGYRNGSRLSDIPILYDQMNYVTETPGASIFAIKDNKILTPLISSDILKSITRQTLLTNILPSLKGISIHEMNLNRWDLLTADEIFLAGTQAEITIVSEIDGKSKDKCFTVNSIIPAFKNFVKHSLSISV